MINIPSSRLYVIMLNFEGINYEYEARVRKIIETARVIGES